jgi:hypothetical protein
MYPFNRGDSFDPFTGPYMKALAMKAYVDDLKFKREAREQQRQAWQMEMEDRKRRQTFEDFQAKIALESMGARPFGAGEQLVDEALTGALGPVTPESRRTITDTPVGRYAIPTSSERATETGRQEGLRAKAREEASDPYEEIQIPADFGGGTAKVPRSKKVDALIKMYEKRFPDMRITEETNDAGDLSIFGTNPRTGEVKTLKVVKGAGKTKTSTGTSVKPVGLSAGARQMLEKAQKAIDYAKAGPGVIDPDDTRSAEDLWAAAKVAAEQAAAAFPDEIEGGPGAGGFPYVRPIVGDKKQAQSQATPVAGKAIKRANLAAAAKAKGMTPEQFEKAWRDGGGTILP